MSDQLSFTHIAVLPKNWLLALAVAGIALASTHPTKAEETSSKSPRVLILGIDGCRPDAVAAANAPNLDRLAQEGVLFDHAQTGEDTVSAPGWSSMLTGVWANKHGVHDNSFRGARYDRYPHFFKRLKEVRPDAFTASIVHWQPIRFLIVRNDANLSRSPGKDERVEVEACKLLAEQDPTVLFLHFDDVDSAGHSKGFHPSVPEYIAAIELVDQRIGRVLEALRARKTYSNEDWLILVSTDHGGKGTSHSNGADIPEIRTIFMIVSGESADRQAKSDAPAYVVDVAATALAHLGVELKPEWQFDGRAIGLKSKSSPSWNVPRT